jgi:thioredoxin-dependent peroxiredoxin
MKKMELGDKLPALSFTSTNPQLQSFDDLKGKNIVLYFYPKDNTPGCTIESKGFRDLYPEFGKLNTEVIGISRDNLASHEKFICKQALPFPLISDEDDKLCELFGTLGEKSLFGRKFKGVIRRTFLIDKNSIVRHIWPKVKILSHAQTVLEAVKAL